MLVDQEKESISKKVTDDEERSDLEGAHNSALDSWEPYSWKELVSEYSV